MRIHVWWFACAIAACAEQPELIKDRDAVEEPRIVLDAGVFGFDDAAPPPPRMDADETQDANAPDAIADAAIIAPDAGPLDNGFVAAPINVPTSTLCNIPDDYIASGRDPTFIPCDVEVDALSDRDPNDVPSELTIAQWNVEFGKASAEILDTLSMDPILSQADFLLLEEVARHNLESSPTLIDQARDIAVRLSMNYVFAVEWDRRLDPMRQGEHGVAILSKYPLGDIAQVRHTPLNDWYDEDHLYGGRITLGATANVGGTLVRLYASHLCTRGGESGRAMQGAEVRAEADRPGLPTRQLAGGDWNTWTCNPLVVACNLPPHAEQIVQDFLLSWMDGNPDFNSWTQLGDGFFPQRLDWLFYRGVTRTGDDVVQNANGSDHRPVVVRFSL